MSDYDEARERKSSQHKYEVCERVIECYSPNYCGTMWAIYYYNYGYTGYGTSDYKEFRKK